MESVTERRTLLPCLGLSIVIVFAIFWALSTQLDPSWKFAVNTLSEFGISGTLAEYTFNYGCCVLCGTLMTLFAIGNLRKATNRGYRMGSILLIIGGILLAFVGIVTMDVGDGTPHDIVAQSMTLFLVLSAVAFAFGNWKTGNKIVTGIVLAMVCMIISMVINFTVAQLEAYGIILIMIWILVESMRIFSPRKAIYRIHHMEGRGHKRFKTAGYVLSTVVGIICLILAFSSFVPDIDAITGISTYMLLAVLFFALSGALTSNGQWSWNTTFLMAFFTMGLIGSLVIFDFVDICRGLLLMILCSFIVFCIKKAVTEKCLAGFIDYWGTP